MYLIAGLCWNLREWCIAPQFLNFFKNKSILIMQVSGVLDISLPNISDPYINSWQNFGESCIFYTAFHNLMLHGLDQGGTANADKNYYRIPSAFLPMPRTKIWCTVDYNGKRRGTAITVSDQCCCFWLGLDLTGTSNFYYLSVNYFLWFIHLVYEMVSYLPF